MRVQGRNLWRNSARRRRLPTSTAAPAVCSPHFQASVPIMLPPTLVSRRFSTDLIETDYAAQSLSASSTAASSQPIPEARRAIEQLCQSNAPAQAEEILRAMEAHESCLPVNEYLRVLRCYVSLNQLEQAFNLLLTMKQTPSRLCFSAVVNALIEANNLPKAKQILYNFMDRGIADTLCFNTLISAYIHQNKRRQAVALLHKMDNYARNGHPKAKADKVTITSMMQKLAQRGFARGAHELLERMWSSPDRNMQPDAVTYSLVFSAFANAPESDPDDAYALLQKMKQRYEEKRELSIRPNTVVYNSFLSVLANVGDGERAQAILHEMEVSSDLNPDAITYGTVLTAWNNASRGDKAEELLWKIPNPDRLCFSITITALGKQGEAKRAEAIMQHMIQQNFRPDTGTLTAILNAWANAKNDPDAFENAKRVLQEMSERQGIVIDTVVFNTFLKAIENAVTLDNKISAVKAVLLRMKQTNNASARPNSATYRQAISAVGATRGDAQLQQKALKFAMQIYQDHKSLPPGQQRDLKLLHSAMLEACGRLSPRGVNGDDIVEQVFSSCCQDGLVTSMHTRLLVKAASDGLLKKIFKTDTVDQKMFHSIPKSWSRKMKGKRRRGGKR